MATLAKVVSIVINGTTVSDPISVSVIRDNELIDKQYGNTRQPRYFQGKTVKGVTFVCADVAIFKAFKKGTRVSTLTAVLEAGRDTDGTLEAGNDGLTIAITSSGASAGSIVTEAVSFESTTDGAPAEYSITVMLCRNGASNGVLTIS